ncbi:MgtC/SapB family protein [Cystobacter fuscus]
MGLDDTTIVLRLLLAFGLGATLGLERELRGHQAGLRTHILVCLGSCLFTLSSLFVALPLVSDTTHEARADISRIASQIVVGIGFLGGGAIIRHETRIKGLTTAANLWLTASVGLACGLGFNRPPAPPWRSRSSRSWACASSRATSSACAGNTACRPRTIPTTTSTPEPGATGRQGRGPGVGRARKGNWYVSTRCRRIRVHAPGAPSKTSFHNTRSSSVNNSEPRIASGPPSRHSRS